VNSFILERNALSISVAAALLAAGCGASQPPIGAPDATPQATSAGTPQRSLADHAYLMLYSFGGSGDGMNPSAALVDIKGTLYGTTVYGGSNDSGTVFAITNTGQETVLHSFGGAGDGEQPEAGLISVKGTLYGTTSGGGANGSGTVFSITPGGTEKVLYGFPYSVPYGNGVPVAGLTDVDGTLYGTTKGDGYGSGMVFSITTGGKFEVLHRFGKKHDGASPSAALLDVNGTLYGTTAGGGKYGRGTVFNISTAGKEQVLYSFGASGFLDGTSPLSALIDVQGTLYGTTVQGGAHGQGGSVFSITTDGTENLVFSFDGSHGSQPQAGLIDVKGVLYGTTSVGGVKNVGTVFSTTTSGEEQVLHSFGKGTDGNSPRANLVEVNGMLYGTTYGGGTNHRRSGGDGTVFALMP
jgi:uncharacterized repeat protein (TIGR03803 family)